MTNKLHSLEVYDLDNYAGPNPIRLTGQFIVRGPEGSQYYILNTTEPLEYEDQQIECIAIRPHYDEDPIANAIDSVCTVGIALPNNGTVFMEGEVYGFNDFVFWKVGKINPSHS